VSRVHGPVDYGNSAGPQVHHGLTAWWVVRLTGLGMFSSSSQWELAATKGKGRGEQHGSHQGLQRPGEMEGWNPSWGWKWGANMVLYGAFYRASEGAEWPGCEGEWCPSVGFNGAAISGGGGNGEGKRGVGEMEGAAASFHFSRWRGCCAGEVSRRRRHLARRRQLDLRPEEEEGQLGLGWAKRRKWAGSATWTGTSGGPDWTKNGP
jgi:hypothetical protein